MSLGYDPSKHIQPLAVAPRTEGILDQREITIQSYQTTVPFDFNSLDRALEQAWLAPQIRFGVFSRIPPTSQQAINVVLALQDELTIRAYDYDARRPLWYSWSNAIVDTVNLHYFRDENGLLRFTTTGGGRRITDDRLLEFNSGFLAIPADATTKRQFDLDKLRELCFKRFKDRLYMVRFAGPSATEYRSIEHALFQSRQYIDPDAERLKEISSDNQVKIESFDSDIDVQTDDLTSSIQVRFFIRGTSGSLRLRFPKVAYKAQHKTPEDQAFVFYRLANAAVSTILEDDYYTQQPRTLADLTIPLDLFFESVDLAPFREVLIREDTRAQFFLNVDLAAPWTTWDPHLRVINELIACDVILANVSSLINELARRTPDRAVCLLSICQKDIEKCRIGGLVARALAGQLQAIPTDLRAQAEEAVISWAVERELECWEVDADTNEIGVLNLRWRIDDFAFDVLPIILWKLVGVLHTRLMACSIDVGPLLKKFAWCMTAAQNLPAHHSKSCAALRLVSTSRAPTSTAEASRILKEPVADLRALDDAVLNQFGLPLWPLLNAVRQNGKLTLTNSGIGAALMVTARIGNQSTASAVTDIIAGGATTLELPPHLASLDMHFEKFGRTYNVTVPITADSATSAIEAKSLPLIINRKRLKEQRAHRKQIDPDGIVVGASPALLQVFEQIHYANSMDGLPPVLLLGEPGVGKTHIARLLHQSSGRASKVFKEVNAGGGGGDINIQRGEWIGYGQGHGIQGIDKNGRAGHLMHANDGTLFIDEFATLSHDLQVIFLSVLDKRNIAKVGGQSYSPDVRCIFATNADVEQEVAKGSLRRDLIDRIPTRIMIPPLRERLGDVLLLAKCFADNHAITDRCMVALLRYQWPGNVRELQNKMLAAKAKQKTVRKNAIDLEHFELPADVALEVQALDEIRCRREIWTLADNIARNEGFEPGNGVQRRAGEILGVGEARASKIYRELCLMNPSAASA